MKTSNEIPDEAIIIYDIHTLQLFARMSTSERLKMIESLRKKKK